MLDEVRERLDGRNVQGFVKQVLRKLNFFHIFLNKVKT